MEIVPSVLHKYKSLQGRGLDQTIEILFQNKVYAAPANKLNDPFEGVSVTFIPNWAGGSMFPLVGLMPPVFRNELEAYRVLSLTEVPTSPQMWAHYADCYRGVCICFQTRNASVPLRAVRYKNEPMRMWEGFDNDQSAAKATILDTAFMIKQRDWAYEQEWRAIYPGKDADEYVDFGEGGVVAVIIGSAASEEHSNRIVDACAQNGIPLYRTFEETWNLKIRIVPYGFRPSIDGTTIADLVKKYCEENDVVSFESLVGITNGGARGSFQRLHDVAD